MELPPIQITIGNPTKPELETIEQLVLVDTGALVLGDECLLGAIPMEDVDVIIHLPD